MPWEFVEPDPELEHNGVKIYPVFKGSTPMTYWFSTDPYYTEDDYDEGFQFDVRDLRIYIREMGFDTPSELASTAAILHTLRIGIELGLITQDGPQFTLSTEQDDITHLELLNMQEDDDDFGLQGQF